MCRPPPMSLRLCRSTPAPMSPLVCHSSRPSTRLPIRRPHRATCLPARSNDALCTSTNISSARCASARIVSDEGRPMAAGQRWIKVDDSRRFTTGRYLRINQGNLNEEDVLITGFGSRVLTDSQRRLLALAKARVAAPRWGDVSRRAHKYAGIEHSRFARILRHVRYGVFLPLDRRSAWPIFISTMLLTSCTPF